MTWSNRSEHRPLSVTAKSGPSQSNDLLIVDEAWAHQDGTLEGNLSPTMIARPQPQMWILSNAGKADSHWWESKWKMGRRLADAGDTESGIAYFEWGAAREDEDFDRTDPDYAARHHPATGWTIDAAGFRAELLSMEDNPDEYDRAYLNLELEENLPSIVTPAAWAATANAKSRIVGTPQFALDISYDRAWAAIAASGQNAQGRNHAQLVKYARGTHWVISWLVDNGITEIAVQSSSQAGALVDDLERAGITVTRLSRADVVAACAGTYDAIVNRTFSRPVDQPALDAAVGAVTWTTGDTRVFSRGKSTIDVSPLYAVAFARWAHLNTASEDYDILSTIA